MGVISSCHGIKGNIVVTSFTEPKSNILSFKLMDSESNPIKIQKIRTNAKGQIICSLAGCHDRNHAESMKGMRLYCDRNDFPELAPEEFYLEDLKNLLVRDATGKTIGIIIDVVNYGAEDMLEIKFDADNTISVFPFTKKLFPVVTKEYITFIKEI